MQDQNIKIRIDAVDNTKKAFNDLNGSLKGAGNSLFTFQNALKTFITAEAIAKVFGIITTFEQLKSSLKLATGSAEDGQKALNFLSKFAETSMFSVYELSDAFVSLYRAGITPTTELLKTFTDTAAAAKNPVEALNALILLFTKGTQGGLGLMQLNRLATENIYAFDLLEKQTGKSKDQIAEMLNTAGGSKDVLEQLRIALAKTFSGAEAEKAKELANSFNDFKNQLVKVTAQLEEGGLNKSLAETFRQLSEYAKLNEPITKFFGEALSGGIDIVNKGLKLLNKGTKDIYDEFGKLTGKKQKIELATDFAEPAKKEIKSLSEVIYQELTGAADKFKREWEDINKTIAVGSIKAIKDVSNAIAESIILGKSLGDAFKEIAQKILIKILANLIEEQIIKAAIYILEQLSTIEAFKMLGIQKLITKEKEKQAKADGKDSTGGTTTGTTTTGILEDIVNYTKDAFKYVQGIFDDFGGMLSNIGNSLMDSINNIFGEIGTSLGDIFNSLGSSLGDIFSSLGGSLGDLLGSFGGSGGGGGFDLGSLMDVAALFGFAEGGTVKAGQPITVGERGREIFIPSTNGTIVPNDKSTVGGMNINFTINATDVRGVQELLINNRATITNLVNQALNQRGKSSIVWVEHSLVAQKQVQYL